MKFSLQRSFCPINSMVKWISEIVEDRCRNIWNQLCLHRLARIRWVEIWFMDIQYIKKYHFLLHLWFLGYITIHRGIPHIFLLPNEDNNLGYYLEKNTWKKIHTKDLNLDQSTEKCISTAIVCITKKHSLMMLINNH